MKMVHYCLLFFSLLVFHGKSFNNSMSCSQTPYPNLCFHFINQNDEVLSADIDDTFRMARFRNSAVQATLNRAMAAHNHLLSAMAQFQRVDEDRDKLALIDCLELYDDSIAKLNHSMINSMSAEPIDHLTLLSSSLANYQTCRDGFRDFELISYNQFNLFFSSQIFSNFSKLISNSLAIAKAEAAAISSATAANSFLEWVSDDDKMLVQKTDGKAADIVVAKDGSGDFRTITEAVAAATKVRKGSGRLVIYVKSGIYRENVEIKKTLKNIMMIGDGIGSTIVTAMNNVHDGSTTFRSATFGLCMHA